MPAAQTSTVNLRQAIAVGILAGLLVVAVVLMLDTVQKQRMWKEVDDALADGARRPLPERKGQHEHRPDAGSDARSNGSVGGFRNGEPIPGVPGDGLDGIAEPPPGGSDA